MTARSRPVRVYLPLVWGDLRATGEIHTRGRGFAVTPTVRDADPTGDLDDWEFAAFSDATQACLALLDGTPPSRRVVVSADIDAARISVMDGSRVAVPDAVPWTQVAAVHLDGEDAEPTVAAVVAGAPGDTLDDVALEWFHPSEIPALLSPG